MTTMVYKPGATVEGLAVNECAVHHASDGAGKRWWNLWLYVARETDGELETFVVPVNPGGGYVEGGPGGKTWGLTKTASGTWQVAPSINVLDDEGARQIQAGEAPTGRSLWHQTPQIVGVPDAEPWANGAAP